jgi:hypothetical protein
MTTSQAQVRTGARNRYEWLVSIDHDANLLQLCPELVLGKYVVVTSFDSGSLSLSDEEKHAGWESRNGIAYSPKIKNIEMLPTDWYDEWYIFSRPVDLGTLAVGQDISESRVQNGLLHVFVNHGGFALDSPEYAEHAQFFWNQLDWIQAESFLAIGDYLNFVSAQKELFASVRLALGAK